MVIDRVSIETFQYIEASPVMPPFFTVIDHHAYAVDRTFPLRQSILTPFKMFSTNFWQLYFDGFCFTSMSS